MSHTRWHNLAKCIREITTPIIHFIAKHTFDVSRPNLFLTTIFTTPQQHAPQSYLCKMERCHNERKFQDVRRNEKASPDTQQEGGVCLLWVAYTTRWTNRTRPKHWSFLDRRLEHIPRRSLATHQQYPPQALHIKLQPPGLPPLLQQLKKKKETFTIKTSTNWANFIFNLNNYLYVTSPPSTQ